MKNFSKNLLSEKFLFFRLSARDQILFIKRLSFLIKAGVPILDSLQMIQEQTRSRGYSRILRSVVEDVSNGQYLSLSLSKHKSFSDFSVHMIHVGETAGMLSENLEYLALELNKKQILKRKVVSAFIYPIIVTIATFGITGFLMVYLFPKIIPVFSSLRIDLPFSTRVVIFISNLINDYGLLIILGIFVFTSSIFIAMKKSRSLHFYFDKCLLKIFGIGQIIQYYNLANATRTMGLLLKSGITISEAVPIVSHASVNLVYKKEFFNLSQTINRGENISKYFMSRSSFFPEILAQVISVGERSGSLSSAFIYVSELYESEVDDFTKNLSTLIEPILMICMGLLVGFIAISIITPIYSITQNLNG